MENQRFKKIENTTKRIVGNFILEELSADDVSLFRMVNILGVKLSSDLSYLDVYVSSFENGDKLTKSLALYANDIQRKLFKELSMRSNPRLRFRYDNSGAIASDIIEKINTLENV